MSSVMRFDEWQDSDGNPVFNGAGGVSPGGLVAVKSAIRDTIFSQAVNGGANVAVPGLSITHEVADPANRLIISAFFGAAGSSFGRGTVALAVHDGTGFIGVGVPGDNRVPVTAGGAHQSDGASVDVGTMPAGTFVHTPGAGSKTYTVRAINIRSDPFTLFINRTQRSDNNVNHMVSISALVIQEVAV